jgi:tRNA (guanine-N7-)-methyltransferase
LARMLAAAAEAQVPNLRVERGDAVALLTDRISAGALCAVHVFFPDPWPKKKHAKRRFFGTPTLSLLASRLSQDGHVLVATDELSYAAWIRGQVAQEGSFVVRDVSRPAWRPVDGFEAKAMKAGRPLVDLRLDPVTR